MSQSLYYVSDAQRQAAQAAESQLRAIPQAPGCATHQAAIILPLRPQYALYDSIHLAEGGVCDAHYNFIAGHLSRKAPHEPLHGECFRAYVPRRVLRTRETVIYGGLLCLQFGTFLMYSLLRLWYVLSHSQEQCRIAFILREQFDPFAQVHFKFLELAGISRERLTIVRLPTQFAAVIVPEQSLYLEDEECVHEQAFKAVYDVMLGQVVPRHAPRIYLSRSRYERHDIFNEQYFEQFFAARGFTILYPERLSPYQQLAYLAGAGEIACTFGTLSHLAVFAREGARLIILTRSAAKCTNKLQLVINRLRKLRCITVDTSLNILPTTHDSYSGYIIGPSLYWREFIKQEYGIESHQDLFAYLNESRIPWGDYLRLYLEQTKTRRNFMHEFGYNYNYTAYLSGLYATFTPASYPELCQAMAITDQPFFRGRRFILRNYLTRDGAAIKLEEEGGITLLETQAPYLTERCSRWSAVNTRLYFLDDSYRPTAEFVITRDAQGSFSPVFNGCMIYNPAIWLCLSAEETSFLDAGG